MSLKKLGRYDLVRVLGKGAMGIVYEGRDPNLERRVAIKTVKVENLSEEAAAEYEARFRTEARSAARLQHPNIVSVYDSDRDGDIAFLVMEYIQGDDLKHHLDKGVRYSLEQSLKMIRDLLSALDYAHKQGIVHRDIKPANLLIEPGGRVKLTDFGVARIQDSGEATRTQGSMVGTLKYMSPEQVQGQKIDSRADLFSVGVVLYQLLTDKRPFDGDNDFSIIHQIIGHTPAAPSSFNGRLPPAIDAVVARALAKDREQRFASARDFASALQSAMRRAEDATVVPPANPFKQTEAGGTGSKGSHSIGVGSASVASGSTVTQELELVYWKDIKDSTDPEELEGFLAKFPGGIYADLARRRLRRLASPDNSSDQTVLSGASLSGIGRGAPDLEATRMRTGTGTTPLVPGAVGTGQDDSSGTTPTTTQTFTQTDTQNTPAPPSVEPASTSAHQASAAGANGNAAQPVSPPASAPSKKPPVAIFAAVGGLAIAGIAAWFLMGKGETSGKVPGPVGAASSAVPAVSVTPAVALTAASAASAVHAAAAASAARAASAAGVQAAASAAKRPASAPKPKVVVPAPAPEPVRPVLVAPAPAPVPAPAPASAAPPVQPREVARPVAPPASAPSAPSAFALVDQCREKNFVMREFCLAEQCVKPGAASHPVCVKFRADAKLREEALK